MGKYTFNFDYLAEKLDEIIEVKDEKKISFTEIFLINDLESVLESAYDFSSEIPESQKQFIIQDGIKKFAYKDKKDGKQLQNQIKKSEKEFLKKPLNKYSVLSSLSFPYFDELHNVRLKKGAITFQRYSYPKKYKIGKLYEVLKNYSNSIPPHGYVPVVININARNNPEAIERALELLDLIRGMWNYSINSMQPSRIYYGPRHPINEIRLGPTHTLHYSNGKLATELYWYEINYLEKSTTWDVMHKWKYISKEFIWIRKSMNKMPYKNDFMNIFIRYTRALDTNDYETSYLKLWSLLEYLTATINSNYDKTISRSLFFYKDDILSKQIIEHLRIFRNKIVHYGESKDDLDSLLFQIKRIVENVIWFHLKFAGSFQSMEEFGRYLDLSKDKSILEKEISLRNKAMKFFYK